MNICNELVYLFLVSLFKPNLMFVGISLTCKYKHAKDAMQGRTLQLICKKSFITSTLYLNRLYFTLSCSFRHWINETRLIDLLTMKKGQRLNVEHLLKGMAQYGLTPHYSGLLCLIYQDKSDAIFATRWQHGYHLCFADFILFNITKLPIIPQPLKLQK